MKRSGDETPLRSRGAVDPGGARHGAGLAAERGSVVAKEEGVVTGQCSLAFLMATEPLWNPTRVGDYRIWWFAP